jgi:hypothetical protein
MSLAGVPFVVNTQTYAERSSRAARDRNDGAGTGTV